MGELDRLQRKEKETLNNFKKVQDSIIEEKKKSIERWELEEQTSLELYLEAKRKVKSFKIKEAKEELEKAINAEIKVKNLYWTSKLSKNYSSNVIRLLKESQNRTRKAKNALFKLSAVT